MPFLAPVLLQTTRKLGYKSSNGYGTQRSFHEAGNSSYVQCDPETGNPGLKSKLKGFRPFKGAGSSHDTSASHSSREAIALPTLSPPQNSIVRTVTYNVNLDEPQGRDMGHPR